jgi:hypothetical protein
MSKKSYDAEILAKMIKKSQKKGGNKHISTQNIENFEVEMQEFEVLVTPFEVEANIFEIPFENFEIPEHLKY